MNSYRKIFKKGEAARRKFQLSTQEFKKMRFINEDPQNITFQKQKEKFIRPLTQYHKFQFKIKKNLTQKQQNRYKFHSTNQERYFLNTPQLNDYHQFNWFNFKDSSLRKKYNSEIKSQSISISLGRKLKENIFQNPKNSKQKIIILPYMPKIKLKLQTKNISEQKKTKDNNNLEAQRKLVSKKNFEEKKNH